MPRFVLLDENIEGLKQFYLKFLEFKELYHSDWDIEISPFSMIHPTQNSDIIVTINDNFVQNQLKSAINNQIFIIALPSKEQQINVLKHDYIMPVLILPCSLKDIFILCRNLEELLLKVSEGNSLSDLIGLTQIAGNGILLKKNNGYQNEVKYDSVLYFEANGEISSMVYVDNAGQKRRVSVLISLGVLEEILGESVFYRTHRRFLVNLLNIKDYGSYPQDVFNFELFQDEFVKISRRKKLEIHNRYKQLRKLI